MTIAEMYREAPGESEIFDDFQCAFDSQEVIYDVLREIASDNAQNAGWREIDDILTEYTEDVESIIDEFGWDGVGRSLSQAASYVLERQYLDDYEDNFKDDLLLCSIHLLEDSYEYEDYPRDLFEYIEELCQNADLNDSMDEIPDAISDWIEENMGDGEFDEDIELDDILEVA